ncbi:MAG TPA: DUF3014 domain-containing protein [Burkholderiaceae bacterium]|nr:DUF3014 domain-containing protein [Burkholderiaceae bacterium]
MTALEKIVFAVLVLVVAGGAYWWWKSQAPEPYPAAPVATPAPAPAPAEPEPGIQHPIEQAPVASGEAPKPLPPLGESDQTAADALASALPQGKLPDFIITKLLVRHIVATVDNLPRDKVAMSLWPIKPTPGIFMVANTPDGKVIAPENSARYALYVRYLESLDAKKVAATYVRLYPLFQQAYKELGYPKGYFNDRLIAVIDHLLATPQVSGALRLEQPKVLYEFADPALKTTSAGQQILLRMGNENAMKVKAKLRELRSEITKQPLKG